MFLSFGIFGFGQPPDPPLVATVDCDAHLRSPWITLDGENSQGEPSPSQDVLITPNSTERLPPNEASRRGHVVIYGGLGLSAVFLFTPLAEILTKQGYSVEIQDLPGSGSCHAHVQATHGDAIQSFLRDDLTRVVREHGSNVHVVAFSTAALVMISVMADLAADIRSGIQRLCYVSVPIGIRGWSKDILGKLISGLEQSGPVGKGLASFWDMVWIDLDTKKRRHTEARQPIPQFSWYPARMTASLRPYQVFAQRCSSWSAGLPLTVIHGARDGKCPWEIVERSAQRLNSVPGLLCLPGAGHAIPLGRAASMFYDHMRDWGSAVTLPD